MKFKDNIPLSKFSNYKIGGSARFFFEPKNEKEIAWAIGEAGDKKVSIFILGGGTNVLLSDEGFDGLVVRPAFTVVKWSGPKVIVGAGVTMEELLQGTIGHALSGLEWAGGLPGTLGGAIRGNAGCFGGEIKDVVVSVASFDPKKMKVVERTAKQCAFGYRDSIFKHEGAKGASGEIILSATLALKKGDKKKIAEGIQEKIAHRVKNHPLEYPNIGSIFKNVPLGQIHKLTSQEYKDALSLEALTFRGSQFSVKTDPMPVLSAAKLIAESGLRGVSFGGAMISPKHPNFIVNVLNARAEDVKNLMTLAKAEVKNKFGVVLEEEVQIL